MYNKQYMTTSLKQLKKEAISSRTSERTVIIMELMKINACLLYT